MPTFISGSTGISGTDGTAATPAVQGTDTNTGIFFPAADTVAVATGGSERMRLDSSGFVGIGTLVPNATLHLYNATNPVLRLAAGAEAGFRVEYITNFAGILNVSSNFPLIFYTNNTERARITTAGDFQFNSGYGSVATAFGCRAWVNFNGTGTVAIRASGNVSSITDQGVGLFRLNFTTAFPDANYSVVTETQAQLYNQGTGINNLTTTSCSVEALDGVNSYFDPSTFCVAIFR